jgi:hypothetical protein
MSERSPEEELGSEQIFRAKIMMRGMAYDAVHGLPRTGKSWARPWEEIPWENPGRISNPGSRCSPSMPREGFAGFVGDPG